VAAILILGWGAYAGTLLSIAGVDDWSEIACDGDYRLASCASTSGWRQFLALPSWSSRGQIGFGFGALVLPRLDAVALHGPADLYRSGTSGQPAAQLPPIVSADPTRLRRRGVHSLENRAILTRRLARTEYPVGRPT
jgi:hypothetical protein